MTPKQAWDVLREQAQKAALVVVAAVLAALSLSFLVMFAWDAFVSPVFGVVSLDYAGALGLVMSVAMVLGLRLSLREDKHA